MKLFFPYQIAGSEWLSHRKVALLADEMGLGKTAQAIRAADIIKARRILVLCPAVARLNWIREFEKFSTFSRQWTTVMDRRTQVSPSTSVVSSYDLATTEGSKWIGRFDLLILDEAHFLKSPDAKRTKAVFGSSGLVHRADRVWALSGTPAPNHAAELWPMLRSFGATALAYEPFVDRFCTSYVVDGHGRRQISGTKASSVPELRRMLSGLMLRRKKEDVMKELPPIKFDHIAVEAGPVDVECNFIDWMFPANRKDDLFKKIEAERAIVEGIVGAGGTGIDSMRAFEALAKSVSTLRRYTGLQKVEACGELIKQELEARAYDKIVIFAVHQAVIEALRLKLADFGPVTLYGGTPPEKRQMHVDKFQNYPNCQVFIGNIQAAGTAITLTAAHQVFFVEQDWVPGNNAQAAMRCHRIGQKHPVFVRFAGLANSIDIRLAQVLKRKTRELAQIFDGLPSAPAEQSPHV